MISKRFNQTDSRSSPTTTKTCDSNSSKAMMTWRKFATSLRTGKMTCKITSNSLGARLAKQVTLSPLTSGEMGIKGSLDKLGKYFTYVESKLSHFEKSLKEQEKSILDTMNETISNEMQYLSHHL